MKLQDYLVQMGMSAKQADIFLTLYRLGPQPASVIARQIDQERTITYKSLLTMVKHGFLSKTTKNKILYFFVNNVESIREKILHQREQANLLADQLPDFVEELQKTQTPNLGLTPGTTLYDGSEGLLSLQQDIMQEIALHGYRTIRRFGSHLYDTNSRSTKTLSNYMPKLFMLLERQKISVSILLGKGISLIEQLFTSTDTQDLINLPTGTNAINIIIVGQTVYILIFEPVPSAIKIAHPLLANTFHFLFEQLEKK